MVEEINLNPALYITITGLTNDREIEIQKLGTHSVMSFKYKGEVLKIKLISHGWSLVRRNYMYFSEGKVYVGYIINKYK